MSAAVGTAGSYMVAIVAGAAARNLAVIANVERAVAANGERAHRAANRDALGRLQGIARHAAEAADGVLRRACERARKQVQELARAWPAVPATRATPRTAAGRSNHRCRAPAVSDPDTDPLLSLEGCRRLLGGPEDSDEQVLAIRDALSAIAFAIVDAFPGKAAPC